MISVRACATVNAEAATKDWFYPLFARRLSPAACLLKRAGMAMDRLAGAED
jgi:hypothetical protein